MARVLEEARKFAPSHGCVLIQGESGTGKELMAAGIHRLSTRADRSYVTLNCSALNTGLLESELFGHQKGAFTGAHKSKLGFFTLATGGTLFLDEIGDMPLNLQAKLLRVIQNKSFHPVGSTELKTTDVRIIAATNVDLIEAVRKKRFRLDLYYRLNVLPIEMPPLRHRLEDLRLLICEFTAKAQAQHHHRLTPTASSRFTERCIEMLSFYPWPGNIRELENLIIRMIITHEPTQLIDIHDLPSKYTRPPGPPELYQPPPLTTSSPADIQPPSSNHHHPPGPPAVPSHTHPNYVDGATKGYVDQSRSFHPTPATTNHFQPKPKYYLKDIIPSLSLPASGINLSQDLKDLESHLIHQALAITGNNKHKAANLLGIKRTTFSEKLKKITQSPSSTI